MTREKLTEASETLSTAAQSATEPVSERLETQAEQLAELASRDQAPDHGRLARHMTILQELHEETDDPAIETAYEQVREFREGVSGV